MKKIQIIASMGLIRNQKGEYLLTKRHDTENPEHDGTWHIPGGGIEFGETPVEALKREMKEELRVEVKPINMIPFVASNLWTSNTTQEHVILLCWVCTIVSGKIMLDMKEAVDYVWFSKEQILSLRLMPFVKEFVEEAEKMFRKAL
jgi:8-oxo-dGTP diphosphatase